jgi:hypothetical protein
VGNSRTSALLGLPTSRCMRSGCVSASTQGGCAKGTYFAAGRARRRAMRQRIAVAIGATSRRPIGTYSLRPYGGSPVCWRMTYRDDVGTKSARRSGPRGRRGRARPTGSGAWRTPGGWHARRWPISARSDSLNVQRPGQTRSRCAIPAARRDSRYLPTIGGLACNLEQIGR